MPAEKIGPIKPKEVAKEKVIIFPDEVFQSFNELIIEKIHGHYATILQKEVVERMVSKGLDRDEIFKKGWLNIESVYQKAGWKVTFDSPGYCESYEPSFEFSHGRQDIAW